MTCSAKTLSYSLLFTALLIAGCVTTPQQWQADKTYHLTVLHTNDHHGRFWTNKYGEYGMPARKTLIDKIRTEVRGKGGAVLLLSGGDMNRIYKMPNPILKVCA